LDLNDALYCLRFLLMILLLVEMMNQSLGTCPKFGVHFILCCSLCFIAGIPSSSLSRRLMISFTNVPEL